MRAVAHFNDSLFLHFAVVTPAASIEQILAFGGVCVCVVVLTTAPEQLFGVLGRD